MKVKGKFEVDIKPLESYADGRDEVHLGRMSIDKHFFGELDASSKGEMLSAMKTASTCMSLCMSLTNTVVKTKYK